MKNINKKRVLLGLSTIAMLGNISIKELKYRPFNPSIFENKEYVSQWMI